MDITALKAKWEKARADLPQTAATILQRHSEDIVNLNRRQLYSGFDGYGKQLQPYADAGRYNGYAAYKHERNPLPGFGIPDLNNTGSNYAKMRAVIDAYKMNLDSDDEKAGKLKAKYGEAIYQLNDESINELRSDILQPDLVVELANQTGATFG